MLKILKHVFFIVSFLAILEFIIIIAKLSPAAFALPTEILIKIPAFFNPQLFLFDVLSTLWRTILSFVLSIPIGIICGFLAVKIKLIKTESEFLIDFLRSIPATALIPLFLVIFGPDDNSKLAVGIFSGSLAISISVLVGFKNLTLDRKRISDLLGIKGSVRIIYYELPEILPIVMLGARTAISLCLILIVVSEMFIGTNIGLGKIIMDYRYSDDIPTIYAAILITGLLGYIINRLMMLIETSLKKHLFI